MKQLIGRHERILTIDGDYIHVMPSETKNTIIFDNMKTLSFAINSIASCKQTKRTGVAFKLTVKRSGGTIQTLEFEAQTADQAADICSKVEFISLKHRKESAN